MTRSEACAMQFMDRLQRLYLEERDCKRVLACLDPDIVWTGTGGDKNWLRYEQVCDYLRLEQLSHPQPFSVRDSSMQAVELSESLCLVEGIFDLEEVGRPLTLRFSAICQMGEEEPRLWRLHLSFPYDEARDALPSPISANQLAALRQVVSDQSQELAEKNENLSALLANLPGGVISCTATDELTLLQYSQGFLDMVGYTAQEMEERFHNNFTELIYPGDLEKTWREVWKQLAEGDTKEIEYRVVRKDGALINILDRGQLVVKETGESVFYCILIDTTENKKAQEELRLSLERYRIVIDQVNDIIFEWDVKRDTLYVSANWKKKFGYDALVEQASMAIPFAGHLHEEDCAAYFQMIQRLKEGSPYQEAELRILRADGGCLWCRVRVTMLQDEAGEPSRGVGIIMDIDQEKRAAQMLQQRAERDGLTGLYNKETTRILIEEYLSSATNEKMGALLIIDVDNFKLVNDRFGHLTGDVILSDIAGILTRTFREHDVIGRVGGDEFAVYMRDLSSRSVVVRKAGQVLQAFDSLTEAKEQMDISCSVGISFAPADGCDYLTLFRNADLALYSAKADGKNQAAVFTDELLLETFPGAGDAHSSVTAPIDSEGGGWSFNSKLAKYVFQIFYQTEDLTAAIPKIMEIVGRQLDVSRVYIFEDSEDGGYTSNTYEWCNDGVEPQIDKLQSIPYEELGSYYDNFRDGIFYCRDVSQLPEGQRQLLEGQQVRSLLQCAIRDNGRYCGFVGFDECRGNRMWTQEQVDGVILISQIVSIFLLKSKAQRETREMLQGLQTVLDHQDSWIYVVAADDYRLLYGNGALQVIWPKMAMGGYCYREFYEYDSPCEICPLRQLDATGGYNGPLYSPVLERTVHAKVSSITWVGGTKAYLFSCADYQEQTDPAL